MRRRIALAGNPNSGKTTLFNRLVGAHAKVGNWPGTTVERRDGVIAVGEDEWMIVDLPGIYSLCPSSLDEQVAHDFLMIENPDVIVVVVDALNLERNLYLAIQLLEMGRRVVIACNMMDLVKKKGFVIDTQKLSEIFQVPVVETVAVTGQGIVELTKKVSGDFAGDPVALRVDYGDAEDVLAELKRNIDFDKHDERGSQLRFKALQILETHPDDLDAWVGSDVAAKIKSHIGHLHLASGEDMPNYLAERRYAYAKGVVRECMSRRMTMEERLTLSDRIDRVVTHPVWGIPIFFAFMYLLFTLVFQLGSPVVEALEQGFFFLGEGAEKTMRQTGLPFWVGSLISHGVLAGMGSVLVFLPYILLLFFGLAFLEDTGYLARGAFIMDRFMHALGLHGKSFIPMLLGFGCNIPGIMAVRTLSSEKDRILTILILPLMSCSARLPVYTLFAGALFPRAKGLVVFSLYLLGILLALIMAKLFKHLLFREETTPLVMELPPYRMPNWKNMMLHMWFRAWLFLKKAGTVIFLVAILAWGLASLPVGVAYASEQSLIGRVGTWIAPILEPAGFGFWQAAVALMLGIIAKEVVVSTFGALYGVENQGLSLVLQQHFTPLSGYAFLVMILIYVPCMATLATIRAETNWKWAVFTVGYTLVLGWSLSVVVYQVGSLLVGA